MQFKTGKLPATYDRNDLLMSRYTVDYRISELPPGDLGYQQFFLADWGMLGNDNAGDCVWAGADHETELFAAMGGKAVSFTTKNTLSDYSAVTGYNPSDPSTDQGTNMRDGMNYRRKTGVVDSLGRRHKIGAYVAVQPGNAVQLKQGIWFFGAAAVGIEFPESAMDQFNAGKAWTVVSGAQVEGGHYVPIVGYNATQDMFYCVTWGRLQAVAPTFLKKYMDEGYVALSEEILASGKSPSGFDLATLQGDLADIGSRVAPTPEPVPTTYPSDASDRELWAATQAWSAARHTGCNKKAATAVKRWAADHGLV